MMGKMTGKRLGAISFAVVFSISIAKSWSALAADAPSMQEWRKSVDDVLEDMRRTVRRRDLLAFKDKLAGLIEKGAEPRDEFLKELRKLLAIAPSGAVLSSLIQVLVAEASPQAMEILLDALVRQDYQDLQGRSVGEGETEIRRRIVEYYVLRIGDRAFRDRAKSPLQVPPELEKKLIEELGAEDPRRVRCAAYLLGGAGQKTTAAAVATAAGKWEKSPRTEAVLLEAVGRIDPEAGAEALLKGASARAEQVRLAVIPWLGLLKDPKCESLIREASESAKWHLRLASVEACRNRRDAAAMDILMARYPKETPRLQHDILAVMLDLTGGVLPPDPAEWQKWWRLSRDDFHAARQGETKRKGPTTVSRQPRYFGFEVWSGQLAIALDISESMSSSNLNLGSSGVAVEGVLKEGSPLAIAKDQIAGLLKKLKSPTIFNLVAYNDQVKPFQKGLIPATPANLKTALKFVDGLSAAGGTDIYGGLAAALADDRVDTIYLLSDGEPTDGVRTEPDDILEAVQEVNRFRRTRINTIQIGEDQELMRELALSSGGKYMLLKEAPAGLKEATKAKSGGRAKK